MDIFRTKKTALSTLAVGAAAALALAGCSANGETSPTADTPTVTEEVTEEATEEVTEEVTETETEAPEETSEEGSEEESPEDGDTEADGERQTFWVEGTATFENFTVTYDGNNQPEVDRIDGTFGYFVEVCVNDDVAEPQPISLDPWTLEYSDGTVIQPLGEEAYTPAYPSSAELAPGECAEGWVAFPDADAPEEGSFDWVGLAYSNSLGDQAIWQRD